MSYENVEKALVLLIETLEHFDDANVEAGDWKIVAEGHDNSVVVEYIRFTSERLNADQTTLITWTARLNLLARYEDDIGVHNLFRDRREELILKILQTPTLPDEGSVATAFDMMLVGGEADTDDDVEIGGIPFLRETIEVEIEEHINA